MKCRVHKYIKTECGSDEVFSCARDNCTHYMPYHIQNMILGRRAECPLCGSIFRVTEELRSNVKLGEFIVCAKCKGNTDIGIDDVLELVKHIE